MNANNDKIMVSISCITYNQEPYIRECLEGFLMQKTNFKFEILIHDDASTDKTADIIREYYAKYPDLIKPILRTENLYSQGVRGMSSFNFERAKGKYITMCEGDDFWCDCNKLQIQFDFMEQNSDYSACGTGSFILNQLAGTYKAHPYLYDEFPIEADSACFKILLGHLPFSTLSIFFRKDIYQNKLEHIKRDCKDAPMGDIQLFFHLAAATKIKLLHNRMVTYRMHKSSVSAYASKRKQYIVSEKRYLHGLIIAENNNRPDWIKIMEKMHKKHKLSLFEKIKQILKLKLAPFYYLFTKEHSNYKKYESLSIDKKIRFKPN